MSAQPAELAALRQHVKVVLREGKSLYTAVRFANTFRAAASESGSLPCPWCFLETGSSPSSAELLRTESVTGRYRCSRCGKELDVPPQSL